MPLWRCHSGDLNTPQPILVTSLNLFLYQGQKQLPEVASTDLVLDNETFGQFPFLLVSRP